MEEIVRERKRVARSEPRFLSVSSRDTQLIWRVRSNESAALSLTPFHPLPFLFRAYRTVRPVLLFFFFIPAVVLGQPLAITATKGAATGQVKWASMVPANAHLCQRHVHRHGTRVYHHFLNWHSLVLLSLCLLGAAAAARPFIFPFLFVVGTPYRSFFFFYSCARSIKIAHSLSLFFRGKEVTCKWPRGSVGDRGPHKKKVSSQLSPSSACFFFALWDTLGQKKKE